VSNTATQQVPSVGRIVHYILDSGRYQGQHRPAIIVNVWDTDPTPESLVQLQVFTDSTNDYPSGDGSTGIMWRTSVHHDEGDANPKGLGTWHWPEYVPSK
jgi:hypothetical protein